MTLSFTLFDVFQVVIRTFIRIDFIITFLMSFSYRFQQCNLVRIFRSKGLKYLAYFLASSGFLLSVLSLLPGGPFMWQPPNIVFDRLFLFLINSWTVLLNLFSGASMSSRLGCSLYKWALLLYLCFKYFSPEVVLHKAYLIIVRPSL